MTKKPVVPGFEGKRRTALESIRRFCLACMDESDYFIRLYLAKSCGSAQETFHKIWLTFLIIQL